MRAKLAKRRHKKHLLLNLSSDPKLNFHSEKLEPNESQLVDIMPPRREWKKLGQEKRMSDLSPINTIDKNIRSLQLTINYFKSLESKPEFINGLEKTIRSIQFLPKKKLYQIRKPEIYPKKKDDKPQDVTKCRPISLFGLKDKIIITLTNKFLTDLFDGFFYIHSYAFRSKREIRSKLVTPSHHDCIQYISEYVHKFNDTPLWVAESDICKFYDSVNHNMIKRSFQKLIKSAKKSYPGLSCISAIRIFESYLKSYSFVHDILPLNKDQSFFEKFHIQKGEFEWIDKELHEKHYYKSLYKERIGVPQGGALSGLIANIVLDYADKKVLEHDDGKLLYIRYCDDMILMHPDQNVCSKAFQSYNRALTDLKLIPHQPEIIEEYSKAQWVKKSKDVYRWDLIENGGIPWIGFVGYEMNRKGDIRVRKKSLTKEMKKQYEIVSVIKRTVEKNYRRVNKKTISDSTINRLTGMSIGRATIWNYKFMKNELCWANGFGMVNDNKYSRIQIRRLDRSRNKLIFRLSRFLKRMNDLNLPDRKPRKNTPKYYGKPFSYYYHIIEKNPR